MLETLEGENPLLSAPVFHVDSPLGSEVSVVLFSVARECWMFFMFELGMFLK